MRISFHRKAKKSGNSAVPEEDHFVQPLVEPVQDAGMNRLLTPDSRKAPSMARTNPISIEEKWQKIADDTRSEASAMPPCQKRDDLLKKARQLDVAVNLNSWLSADPKTAK